MTCPQCESMRRLNLDLANRLAAAAHVLSLAAERNGLVHEVQRLQVIVAELSAAAAVRQDTPLFPEPEVRQEPTLFKGDA